LGIKEKSQERGEEEGCMERNVHIGNEWWKILTVHSKEMRTTTRRVENTMKKGQGGDFSGRIGKQEQEIGKKRKGMEKEKQKIR
jgi:hypothetical protein